MYIHTYIHTYTQPQLDSRSPGPLTSSWLVPNQRQQRGPGDKHRSCSSSLLWTVCAQVSNKTPQVLILYNDVCSSYSGEALSIFHCLLAIIHREPKYMCLWYISRGEYVCQLFMIGAFTSKNALQQSSHPMTVHSTFREMHASVFNSHHVSKHVLWFLICEKRIANSRTVCVITMHCVQSLGEGGLHVSVCTYRWWSACVSMYV